MGIRSLHRRVVTKILHCLLEGPSVHLLYILQAGVEAEILSGDDPIVERELMIISNEK